MARFAFLILNYKNLCETNKCVQSIDELANNGNVSIVIVDNGSGDGSYEQMQALYGDRSEVHLIKLDDNLGFSKGNNLGYQFIRDNLQPDFIIVTNNDVVFPQQDMLRRIEEIYSQSQFYVLGPDIYKRANHEHQSPMRLTLPTKEELERQLSEYEYYSNNPERWVQGKKLWNIKKRIRSSHPIVSSIYHRIRNVENIDYRKTYTGCCVQGACIIVSSNYWQAEDKMFSPETFLFGEELLLYKKCKKRDYAIVYDPGVQVWHEHNSTMKKINAGELEETKFAFRHRVEALKILIDNWD